MRQKRFADAAQVVQRRRVAQEVSCKNVMDDVSLKFQKALDERDEGQIAVLAEEFTRLLDRLLDEIAQTTKREATRLKEEDACYSRFWSLTIQLRSCNHYQHAE